MLSNETVVSSGRFSLGLVKRARRPRGCWRASRRGFPGSFPSGREAFPAGVLSAPPPPAPPRLCPRSEVSRTCPRTRRTRPCSQPAPSLSAPRPVLANPSAPSPWSLCAGAWIIKHLNVDTSSNRYEFLPGRIQDTDNKGGITRGCSLSSWGDKIRGPPGRTQGSSKTELEQGQRADPLATRRAEHTPLQPALHLVRVALGPCAHLALTFQSQEIQWHLSLLLRFPGRLEEAGESESHSGALGLFLGRVLQLAASRS